MTSNCLGSPKLSLLMAAGLLGLPLFSAVPPAFDHGKSNTIAQGGVHIFSNCVFQLKKSNVSNQL